MDVKKAKKRSSRSRGRIPKSRYKAPFNNNNILANDIKHTNKRSFEIIGDISDSASGKAVNKHRTLVSALLSMNEYELSMSLPDLSPTSYQASCIECSCCYCVLGRQRDFLEQPEQRSSGIEEAYSKFNCEHNSKHRCLFLPKLHPELNYIERIWGRMKYDTRLHCDTKFDTMVRNIAAAMGEDNLPIAMIRRFSQRQGYYH